MPEILPKSGPNARTGGASFTRRNRIYRFAWVVCWTALARWTPSPFWRWRRFVLGCFGARLHKFSDVRGSAKVWSPKNLVMGERSILAENVNCYNMACIRIGSHVVISQGVHLCCGSHAIDDGFQLVARPITIGDNAWIAAEAFVGPGVSVGKGTVLSARGVAFTDLEEARVYRGNPAIVLRVRHLQET